LGGAGSLTAENLRSFGHPNDYLSPRPLTGSSQR